jgi:hydrogenase/urease accessory protein HupE
MKKVIWALTFIPAVFLCGELLQLFQLCLPAVEKERAR